MRKLKQENGTAFVFFVLGALILVMLILILVPMYYEKKEATAEEIDTRHEETARDSMKLEYIADGSYYAIYDYYNKKFVRGKAAKDVEPYGETKEHEGKVIYVWAYKDGTIKLKWDVPKEVPYDITP